MWWWTILAACEPAPEPHGEPAVTETGVPTTICAQFVEEGAGTGLGDIAGDFSVPLVDGTTWSFREQHTGCDSILFVPSSPAQEEPTDEPLWSRDTRDLLALLPRNTHVFFVPSRPGEKAADLDTIQKKMDRSLGRLSEDDEAWWRARIHYVDRTADKLDGWLSEVLVDPGWGIGIDRFQRIRYLGSLADGARYNGSWFDDNLAFVAYEAQLYEFEAERQVRLDAQDATVVPIFEGVEASDPSWAGEAIEADVTFPDAASMATFDRLELDLHLGCVGEGELGTCPAWDYDVWAYLCDEADPTSCGTWIGHWITTYHREGRWVVDASFALPLLAGGGVRRMRFYTQQPYEVTLSARLYDDPAEELRPVEAVPLFSGGAFDATYNDREPVEVPIPQDAARVRLAAVITGHGGVQPGNCAEFCDTDHRFVVNGVEHLVSFPDAGNDTGCQDSVRTTGTIPNQYGTWFYGRSNWCPGRQVDPIWIDVTADVTPGQPATLTYEGTYEGAPYPTAGAHINLSSWLVFER